MSKWQLVDHSMMRIEKKKEKLHREGRLPVSILCNPESILEARKAIDIVENNV